jgi:D-proline reductase (dithiol) PrdB
VASLDDLKLSYRLFMRAYPYRSVDWRPGAYLAKPLSEAVIAVVTTAAFYLPTQPAFDEGIRGGDWSFREIPVDAELGLLGIAHKSDAFDHRGIEADKNLALPLDRLREMEAAGEIGGVARVHYSFMGSVTAPGRLMSESAPEVARRLQEQQVDAVVLTPV